MRQFMPLKMYGRKETTYTEKRATKWRKMKKKSHGCLPPDEECLYHYLDQVNYLSYFLKHCELNRHPSPIGRGWEHIKGKCPLVQYAVPATADILQPQLLARSDDGKDDGSNGEYRDNSDDYDTNSE